MPKILSKETIKKLKEELERLKTIERRNIAEKIKIAKSFGDLSENAEYHSALEEQKRLEMRIFELEQLLKNAKVAKNKKSEGIVDIGSEVSLIDLKNRKKLKFKIVGFGEANPLENKISTESPLGKALLGKKKNDVIEINIKGEAKKFKIKEVK
jgi:transcription elongation factor GreA